MDTEAESVGYGVLGLELEEALHSVAGSAAMVYDRCGRLTCARVLHVCVIDGKGDRQKILYPQIPPEGQLCRSGFAKLSVYGPHGVEYR